MLDLLTMLPSLTKSAWTNFCRNAHEAKQIVHRFVHRAHEKKKAQTTKPHRLNDLGSSIKNGGGGENRTRVQRSREAGVYNAYFEIPPVALRPAEEGSNSHPGLQLYLNKSYNLLTLLLSNHRGLPKRCG
jgi:hypothetical protein